MSNDREPATRLGRGEEGGGRGRTARGRQTGGGKDRRPETELERLRASKCGREKMVWAPVE